LTRTAANSRGQTLIEFAVTLPVFCVLLFGVFEFGMALASDCSATYAIREGSRFASLHSSTSLAPATTAQIQNVVTQNLFMPNAVSIAVGVYYGGGNAINGEVGIGLTWNQQVNIPFFKNQSLAMNVATYRWITR
jgi:Flp pilus assembly protein TadG